MIILTGAAGFIGSCFLTALNQSGHKDIWLVDSFESSHKWKNLLSKSFTNYTHKDEFIELVKTRNLPGKIEAIIHLGACSSTLETDVDYLMRNNFQYSVEIAKLCAEKDIPLIYASSAATYGDGSLGFSDTDSINNLRPLNAYGYSKQIFDLWLQNNGLGDKFTGLKFFNVFGPNEYYKDDMRSMVLKGYEQIVKDKKIKLFKSNTPEFKDGGQMRDFVYVKDCCDAMLWFMKNPKVTGLFNLGNGKARSWNDLSTAIFNALEIPVNIEYIPMPEQLSKQYQNFTEAPMQKLRAAGFTKEFRSLEDSVTDYVQNYLIPSAHA